MSRARLPIPVRRALREPLDEPAIEAAIARARRPAPARRLAPRVLAPVAIGLLAASVLLFFVLRPGEGGPLRRPDGAALAGTMRGPAHVELADGSSLALGEGARLEVLENGERELGLLLASGTVTFDVAPGGPRRWVIEAGLATVVVLGTRFTVERSTDRLTVSVARGAVLVRGERVPERARRLGAGESIVIEAPARETHPATRTSEPPEASAAPVSLSPDESDERTARGARTARRAESTSETSASDPARWRTLAEQGDYQSAWADLGAEGVRAHAERAGVDELLALADVARLSGHPDAAVAPLERILDRHRGHPSAAVAAFTLGRVEADALRRPAQAARAFEQALELGLTSALRPDALARLARAWRDAGDDGRARAAAARYLAELPEGRHAESMRALLEASP